VQESICQLKVKIGKERSIDMSDELKSNWKSIIKYCEKSLQSNQFFTFATTNPDGSPHMAPYASLVLKDDCTGYYSDVFPNRMSRNLKRDPRICISAVYMGMGVWLKGFGKKDLPKNCAVIRPGCKALRVGNIAYIHRSEQRSSRVEGQARLG
jgi:hypothetical protein